MEFVLSLVLCSWPYLLIRGQAGSQLYLSVLSEYGNKMLYFQIKVPHLSESKLQVCVYVWL